MDFLKFEGDKVFLERDELLLVKEFKELISQKRNICKSDPKGELGLKAIKELTYIYLGLDWKSPYSDYSEQERTDAARYDSELTEKELQDPIFIQACKKYQEMQDTRILKMLRSTYKAIDNLRIFFETVDLTETDTITGKPIYNAKDIISNIQNLGKMIGGLQELEMMVRKEREQAKSVRGDATPGIFDN